VSPFRSVKAQYERSTNIHVLFYWLIATAMRGHSMPTSHFFPQSWHKILHRKDSVLCMNSAVKIRKKSWSMSWSSLWLARPSRPRPRCALLGRKATLCFKTSYKSGKLRTGKILEIRAQNKGATESVYDAASCFGISAVSSESEQPLADFVHRSSRSCQWTPWQELVGLLVNKMEAMSRLREVFIPLVMSLNPFVVLHQL